MKKWTKFLCPTHPICCIITRPTAFSISYFLTDLSSNIIDEFEKVYIYSPRLPQDFYQKLIKRFSSYIPMNIIPKILDEEDVDLVIDEIVRDKDSEKSDTEMETYDSIE